MLGAEEGESKLLCPTITRNEAEVFPSRWQSYHPFMRNLNLWGAVGRAWALVSDTLWLESSYFPLESRQFSLSKFFKFPEHLSPCSHLCLEDYNRYIKELLWELQGVKYPSVWQIVSRHSNVQFFFLFFSFASHIGRRADYLNIPAWFLQLRTEANENEHWFPFFYENVIWYQGLNSKEGIALRNHSRAGSKNPGTGILIWDPPQITDAFFSKLQYSIWNKGRLNLMPSLYLPDGTLNSGGALPHLSRNSTRQSNWFKNWEWIQDSQWDQQTKREDNLFAEHSYVTWWQGVRSLKWGSQAFYVFFILSVLYAQYSMVSLKPINENKFLSWILY